MTETAQVRLKRLKMRSMRRGMKEMDLILSAYAEANLEFMSLPALTLYEALLHENDQQLYHWITDRETPPEHYGSLIADISQTFRK